MTIAAWDGKTLAVDSRVETDTLCEYMHKPILKRFKELYAGAGSLKGVYMAFDIIRERGSLCSQAAERLQGHDIIILQVKQDGAWIYASETLFNPLELRTPYVAIGSGAEVATGALAAGATAEEAAKIACLHAAGCGGAIMTYTLED